MGYGTGDMGAHGTWHMADGIWNLGRGPGGRAKHWGHWERHPGLGQIRPEGQRWGWAVDTRCRPGLWKKPTVDDILAHPVLRDGGSQTAPMQAMLPQHILWWYSASTSCAPCHPATDRLLLVGSRGM